MKKKTWVGSIFFSITGPSSHSLLVASTLCMALIEKNMNKAALSLNLINTDVFVLRAKHQRSLSMIVYRQVLVSLWQADSGVTGVNCRTNDIKNAIESDTSHQLCIKYTYKCSCAFILLLNLALCLYFVTALNLTYNVV